MANCNKCGAMLRVNGASYMENNNKSVFLPCYVCNNKDTEKRYDVVRNSEG